MRPAYLFARGDGKRCAGDRYEWRLVICGSFLRSSAESSCGVGRRGSQLPLPLLLLPALLLLLAAAVAELEGAPFSSAFTSAGRLRLAPALLFGSRGFHSAAERTTRSCASSSTYCSKWPYSELYRSTFRSAPFRPEALQNN